MHIQYICTTADRNLIGWASYEERATLSHSLRDGTSILSYPCMSFEERETKRGSNPFAVED